MSSVPASFMGITNSMSAHRCLTLLRLCQDVGVDPNDTPAVRKLWEEAVSQKRDELQRLTEEKRQTYLRLDELRKLIDQIDTDYGVTTK